MRVSSRLGCLEKIRGSLPHMRGGGGGWMTCGQVFGTYRISLNRSRTLINSRPRIGRLVALLLNLLTRAPRIGRAHPPVVQS